MSSAILGPREASKFIASRSKDVKILTDGIRHTAQKIFGLLKNKEAVLDVDRWKLNELNPVTEDDNAVEWVFVTDLLNFSFWCEPNHKYMVRCNGKEWTGYWSLCAALNRAIDAKVPITNPTFYGNISRDELDHLFRSDSSYPMPLLDERLSSLHMAAKVLLEKYDGRFVNVIKSCNRSAKALVKRVVEDFPTFRDETEYDGQKVAIYKRAQILVADIWACCGGRGLGAFDDIECLTAFADYRIPQVLGWFGVLEYSEPLLELLQSDHLFNYGDRLEVEIRGCTLWAIELLVQKLRDMIREDKDLPDDLPMNAIILDHFLWDFRREHDNETDKVPFHKVRCIYY